MSKKEFKFEKILGDCHINFLNVYKYVHKDGRVMLTVERAGGNGRNLSFKIFKTASEYSNWINSIDADTSNGWDTRILLDQFKLRKCA